MILVDAGPMVALLSANDQHRASCSEAVRRLRGPLATVWPALTEAMHLLKPSPIAQQTLLKQVENGALSLLPLAATDVPRMKELMRKYADRPMDLADAALVRVAERERIFTIFTVDRSDFAAYRPLGRRFKIVP